MVRESQAMEITDDKDGGSWISGGRSRGRSCYQTGSPRHAFEHARGSAQTRALRAVSLSTATRTHG
eukprot:9475408-Pyramimonas_sp.AAC.1